MSNARRLQTSLNANWPPPERTVRLAHRQAHQLQRLLPGRLGLHQLGRELVQPPPSRRDGGHNHIVGAYLNAYPGAMARR